MVQVAGITKRLFGFSMMSRLHLEESIQNNNGAYEIEWLVHFFYNLQIK